jgi:hypothetical protein
VLRALLSLLIVALLAGPVEARKRSRASSCESTATKLIKGGYGRGGKEIKRLLGPFRWNEPFFSSDGDPGLRHRVAFVVIYDEGRKKGNTVLLVGECQEGDPSKLIDANNDKKVNLADLTRVGLGK